MKEQTPKEKVWLIIFFGCGIVLGMFLGCLCLYYSITHNQSNVCDKELDKIHIICIEDFLDGEFHSQDFKYIRIIDCNNFTKIRCERLR